jgi:hypothetical protein
MLTVDVEYRVSKANARKRNTARKVGRGLGRGPYLKARQHPAFGWGKM